MSRHDRVEHAFVVASVCTVELRISKLCPLPLRKAGRKNKAKVCRWRPLSTKVQPEPEHFELSLQGGGWSEAVAMNLRGLHWWHRKRHKQKLNKPQLSRWSFQEWRGGEAGLWG